MPPLTDTGPAGAVASIADCLDAAADRLARAGSDTPRRDARLLLAHCLACGPDVLIGWPERPVTPADRARFDGLVSRRGDGVPVSRLVGVREFWSLPFRLSPATLDPRPDTETVVEAVLAARPDRRAAWRLLDLGTGSGCLLLALLHEYPAARGVGLDVAADAVATAQANAAALGMADRAGFRVGDWNTVSTLAPEIAWPVDVLVTNPPYIPKADIAGLAPAVVRFDPIAALDGGSDGLAAYRVLVPLLSRLVAPGGLACFECGQGQAAAVRAFLSGAGMHQVTTHHDLAGIERCISATV